MEGLWVVQYQGIQGNGGGAVVFVNGRVLGGDTGYVYVGTYEVVDGGIAANVHVTNFLPEIPNVLGIAGDFDLQITAEGEGRVLQGTAALAGRPGAGIAVRLTKYADL